MSEESFSGGPYFGPGTPSTAQRAVLYQGEFQNEHDGTGVAVRLHARALAEMDVPVMLKSVSGVFMSQDGILQPLHMGVPERVEAEVGHLIRTEYTRYYPSIRHLVLARPEHLSQLLLRGVMGSLDEPEKFLKAKALVYEGTVLYTVWERDSVSPDMVRELNRVKENWVPCEQNAAMLRRSGVERVRVVPHPFDPKSPLTVLTGRRPKTSRDFYSIGRWEPRKNHAGLIYAFCEAFSPEDDVTLTIKTSGSWPGLAAPAEVLSEASRRYPEWNEFAIKAKIKVIEKNLRPDQIVKLHFAGNIYVSASCGEAWGLPAFEAKVAGNRVIATGFGGPEDFCETERGDVLLPYQLTEVPESYGWQAGTKWAEVDHAALVEALRKAEAPADHTRSDTFDDRFSMRAVGRQMRDRLKQLYPEAFP